MKHFQPGPKCGNCQNFRHSVGHVDSHNDVFVVTKFAECGKEVNPKSCGEEFQPRNKKGKRMKNRMKKWERQFNY